MCTIVCVAAERALSDHDAAAVDPALDDRAAKAAHHVGLAGARDDPLERLQTVSTQAKLDLRDLEASLVRLWLAHGRQFRSCAGGPRCSVLAEAHVDRGR